MDDFKVEKNQILIGLICFDIWHEDLLSDELFGKTFETVLSKRERLVLSLKCEGKSEEYILKVLNQDPMQGFVKLSTLKTMKRTIKKKLTAGFTTQLPGWIRGKVWENERIPFDDDPYENGQSLFKPI